MYHSHPNSPSSRVSFYYFIPQGNLFQQIYAFEMNILYAVLWLRWLEDPTIDNHNYWAVHHDYPWSRLRHDFYWSRDHFYARETRKTFICHTLKTCFITVYLTIQL